MCIPLLQAYLVARILWLVDVTCEHTRVVVVYMYTVPSLVVYVVVEYRCMHMHIPVSYSTKYWYATSLQHVSVHVGMSSS